MAGTTDMTHVPVAIVGGGPVGMVLAIGLAGYGVRTVLVNTETDTRWFPKGSTHNARTMEHYRRLGLSRDIRRLGLPADHPTDVGFFTALNGFELARIAMPSEREKAAAVANAAPADQVPEPIFRCNQMYVEAHLLAHIRTLGAVDLRFGWRCVEIAEGGDGGVAIVIENVATGAREEIACDYLAGCDGPQSTVRRHLGISYRGDVPEEQAYGSGATVATHLRAPGLYRILEHRRCWQYRTVNPSVRSNLVTLDGEGEFTINTKLRHPDEKPDPTLVADLIRQSVGADIAIEFLEHRPWTAGHALVAERFGAGRIALAGDAVHVFTPTGGFGMNTGVDDAVNLAWKLAALVAGWGGPKLLPSYEIERRPIALRNTGMAKELSRGAGRLAIGDDLLRDSPAGDTARASLGKELAAAREEFASIGIQLGARYDDSPIVVADGTAPPADSPFVYRPTGGPGGRAPHLFLRDGTSLFDRFGKGFCLLHLHGDHDTGPIEEAARARRMPLTVLPVDLPEGRELYACDLALIRPDQHVAWRGSALPWDCGQLLARVTGW
jgi:2-polyprenyl-6-methoxyphenol hydroxylase-like FAD-dependent oxidoreductase